ncbi:MAG: response regulator, partial [Candidatus Eisenbacteria bacterium]|nr:response regulator [Candidatus Eisenbacteria bacterium]
VVSDERMPESSGIDFLSHVSELYPCVITILFTGRADMATAIRAINEGHVHHFLVKPCALKEVTSILEEAVQLGRIARAGETGPQRVRQERSAIKRLERYHPGITRVHKNEDGSIAIDDPESAAVTSAPDDEPLH